MVTKNITRWVSKTNGLKPAGEYTFDADGKMVVRNGIIDGYYYVNGVKTSAGMLYIDGNYYFAAAGGKLKTSESSWCSYNNGLLPSGMYRFDAEGKIIMAAEVVNEDGVMYYYKDGRRVDNAGLILYNGDYYLISSGAMPICNETRYVSRTNGHLVVALGTQVLNNLVIAAAVSRLYPQYRPHGKLPSSITTGINRRIRDLFTGKVGSVVMNFADSVVVSAFLGLEMLTNYQNYYFIMSAIIGMIEIFLQSVMAGLGNSFITESKQKHFKDLQKATYLFLWLIGVCACCFLGLYQPFMELWVGPEMVLPAGVMICFVIYFLTYTLNRLLNVYKDAAGLWHKDRFRPLVKACVNLTLNLVLVRSCDLYGVLLSTVFAIVVIGMPWLLHNLFTGFFTKDMQRGYLKQLLGMTALILAVAGFVYLLCWPIQGNLWLALMLRGAICVIVPNLLFLAVLHRSEQFAPSVQLLDRLTKHKLKLEKRLLRHKKQNPQ